MWKDLWIIRSPIFFIAVFAFRTSKDHASFPAISCTIGSYNPTPE